MKTEINMGIHVPTCPRVGKNLHNDTLAITVAAAMGCALNANINK